MSRGNRIGRRRRRSGTVVVSGDIAILQTPLRFAPSVETCPIRYSFSREHPGSEIHINIKDKNGNAVKRNNLSLGDLMHGPTNRSGTWEWDGKDDSSHYVTPLQSPLTVQMRHASGVAVSKLVNIEIGQIALWVEGYDENNRLMMNNPNGQKAVVATVYLKKTDGSNVRTRVPIEVSFSFEDPNDPNTARNDSFKYQNGPDKYLGKRSDNNAIHWQADPGWTTNSDDGFKTKCKVAVNVNSGANLSKVKVFFKPSSVGGDDFKLKATVYASDGTTVITGVIGRILTVWRSVAFDRIYEMHGLNHVSNNAISANISSAFNPAFVKYTAGAANSIPDGKSVEYIGLWKDTSTPQESWATIQSKLPDETPTEDEINNATYAGIDAARVTARTAARNAIIRKAQRWVDRIDGAFATARGKWISDAGIRNDSLVAIRYYHPKYSVAGGNSVTYEWNLGSASTPVWLRVTTYHGNYRNIDPDSSWPQGGGSFGGLSHGNGIVTIPQGRPDIAVQQTIIHETGHATKSHFKRDVFGPNLDHTVSNLGVMYWQTNGVMNFIVREKNILRGIKP